MEKCVITGSFDPFTNGHQYLVDTACSMFDKVYLAIFINPDKQTYFNIGERIQMLNAVAQNNPKIEVAQSDGMVIDWCNANGVKYIIRGVRNTADYEYERAMAEYNFQNGKVITLFVNSINDISSQEARQLLEQGKNIDKLVPNSVLDIIMKIKAIKE